MLAGACAATPPPPVAAAASAHPSWVYVKHNWCTGGAQWPCTVDAFAAFNMQKCSLLTTKELQLSLNLMKNGRSMESVGTLRTRENDSI